MRKILRAVVIDEDRRRSPRHESHAYALICAKGESDFGSCIVKSISSSGARIVLEEDFFVPKTFKLYIAEEHIIADCEYAWRKGNEVGLTFRSQVRMR